VELTPIGYMIYHNDSGIFVERSAATLSPYSGIYGELYYGGFTQYYHGIENGDFIHTISGNVVEARIVEEYNWSGYSAELTDNFLATADFAVLEYVERGTMPMQTMNSQPTAWTNVAYMTFIQNQTTVNNPGGTCPVTKVAGTGFCSYVALAIQIGYFDHVTANRQMGIISGTTHVLNRHTTTARVQQAFVTINAAYWVYSKRWRFAFLILYQMNTLHSAVHFLL